MSSTSGLASGRGARVLVFASARLFGESLGACLERDESVDAVLVEHDATDLARKTRQFDADVVLFDVTPRRGLLTVRALTDEFVDVPIVALAVPGGADEVIACADAGFV